MIIEKMWRVPNVRILGASTAYTMDRCFIGLVFLWQIVFLFPAVDLAGNPNRL
jgi:hypothetical protein